MYLIRKSARKPFVMSVSNTGQVTKGCISPGVPFESCASKKGDISIMVSHSCLVPGLSLRMLLAIATVPTRYRAQTQLAVSKAMQIVV